MGETSPKCPSMTTCIQSSVFMTLKSAGWALRSYHVILSSPTLACPCFSYYLNCHFWKNISHWVHHIPQFFQSDCLKNFNFFEEVEVRGKSATIQVETVRDQFMHILMTKPPISEVLSFGFWALISTYETHYQRAGKINQPRFLRVARIQ